MSSKGQPHSSTVLPPGTPCFGLMGAAPIKVTVWATELVEPVLVPSLGSRVDLPGLASKQQQPAAAAAASTREVGKNDNSVVVFRIRLKFW